MRKCMVYAVIVGAMLCLTGGCGALRLAPGERQKQNVYLHLRTTAAAARQAREEEASETLRRLTELAAVQSEAVVAYYGLPEELPAAGTVEQLLHEDNLELARQARAAAMQRPDPFDVADYLMEVGIALAGVIGGVFGSRATGAIRLARQKSTALREIIQGNETFKRGNPLSVDSFKEAQQGQSQSTRELVAEMK